ncbi:MAG: recombinase family protein [Novosphingobium sp.]
MEREITGERIRDKIAASKAKGMWMGGVPPLGYDLPAPGSRKLQVNEAEAVTVRMIFALYLDLGSVHQLQRELAERGIVSKQRITASGRDTGGVPFSRGAVFHLLRNRIYLGQILHKGQVHDGTHFAIVEPALFDAVQQHLDGNARRHRSAADVRVVRAPLVGKLFDASGEAMSPAFSRGRGGRVYRYYVSASLQQGAASCDDGILRRVSAPAIERLVSDTMARLLPAAANSFDQLKAVRLQRNDITLELHSAFAPRIRGNLADGETITSSGATCSVTLALALPLRGGRRSIEAGQPHTLRHDPVLSPRCARRNAWSPATRPGCRWSRPHRCCPTSASCCASPSWPPTSSRGSSLDASLPG